MNTKTEGKCDFCGLSSLNDVYIVPESARGAVIQACMNCGLLQTRYTKELTEKIVSTDSGPNWGNLRYGKEMAFAKSVEIIQTELPNMGKIKNVLDIGSSRGHFIQWASEQGWEVDAVEPDESIIGDVPGNCSLMIGKFEDFEWPKEYYDLVYCCHTLEHADSASNMLKGIYSLLKSDGCVYLEVPQLPFLRLYAGIEEFFIDKHKFHFGYELENFCNFIGLQLYGDLSDEFVTRFILQKFSYKIDYFESDFGDYSKKLKENRNLLKKVASRLNELSETFKIVYWGAGRQFDALVKAGLDMNKAEMIIDDYLCKYMPYSEEYQRFVFLSDTTNLTAIADIIVVTARASSDEIVEKAKNMGCTNIITLSELMDKARKE